MQGAHLLHSRAARRSTIPPLRPGASPATGISPEDLYLPCSLPLMQEFDEEEDDSDDDSDEDGGEDEEEEDGALAADAVFTC